MKFINTGTELLSADCIETISPVEAGINGDGVTVWAIRITTKSDNYYYYNPDKAEILSKEAAAALVERLVKEIQEDKHHEDN